MRGRTKHEDLADDSLATPEVGAWCEQKYRLVSTYANMFATSMKAKWECRVYVDLFAGAGRSRIRGSDRIVRGSPLLAMDVDDPFDRYVFCEQDSSRLKALTRRVTADYPDRTVAYHGGDVNRAIPDLVARLPMYSKAHRVLTFCFIDPYKLGDLWFTTIEQLNAARAMDFLVLIPTQMDAGRGRNMEAYCQPGNKTLDQFLGGTGWREEWDDAKRRGRSVDVFVPDCFGRKMQTLGFIYEGVQFTKQVRTDDKNVPLYRLAFFSKSKLGWKFWLQALKYSDDQIPLL